MTDQEKISLLCFALGLCRGALFQFRHEFSDEQTEIMRKCDDIIEKVIYG